MDRWKRKIKKMRREEGIGMKENNTKGKKVG
jgi:hypothetical protein